MLADVPGVKKVSTTASGSAYHCCCSSGNGHLSHRAWSLQTTPDALMPVVVRTHAGSDQAERACLGTAYPTLGLKTAHADPPQTHHSLVPSCNCQPAACYQNRACSFEHVASTLSIVKRVWAMPQVDGDVLTLSVEQEEKGEEESILTTVRFFTLQTLLSSFLKLAMPKKPAAQSGQGRGAAG